MSGTGDCTQNVDKELRNICWNIQFSTDITLVSRCGKCATSLALIRNTFMFTHLHIHLQVCNYLVRDWEFKQHFAPAWVQRSSEAEIKPSSSSFCDNSLFSRFIWALVCRLRNISGMKPCQRGIHFKTIWNLDFKESTLIGMCFNPMEFKCF